ncbi:MAG: C39 family peptidase [Candidatus Aenigmatarchaeota archaeon]
MLENSFGALVDFFLEPTEGRIIGTILILLVGIFLTKLISKLSRHVTMRRTSGEDAVESIKKRKSEPSKIVEYIALIFVILIALLFLNAPMTNNIIVQTLDNLPTLISTVLIIVLGFIVVNLVMDLLRRFFEAIDMGEFTEDFGLSPRAVDIILKVFRIFLYVLVVQMAVVQAGVSSYLLEETLKAAAYAIVFVVALILFFGFKDLVVNYAAGFYLKSSNMFKKGRKVKFKEESGEIRDITKFGTTISTDSGYFMFVPNSEAMDGEVYFKRTKADVETLDEVTDYFRAQNPAYCGPASAEMALAIFGYDVSQEEIGEEAGTKLDGGTEGEDLADSVESLTNGEVYASYISYEEISNLKRELKVWLNDGALVVLHFMKPVIFPDATTGHYVLCLGVEGDEILVMDPSSKSGGVYYVSYSDMQEAMKEYDKSRGYIPLAPKGTTAYWRLKEGLVYSHPKLYDKLSKSLEVQLSKIARKGNILKEVIPSSVSKFAEDWRSEEKVRRIWVPEEEDEEGGLDEFIDDN